jgi:hypothetical protein
MYAAGSITRASSVQFVFSKRRSLGIGQFWETCTPLNPQQESVQSSLCTHSKEGSLRLRVCYSLLFSLSSQAKVTEERKDTTELEFLFLSRSFSDAVSIETKSKIRWFAMSRVGGLRIDTENRRMWISPRPKGILVNTSYITQSRIELLCRNKPATNRLMKACTSWTSRKPS